MLINKNLARLVSIRNNVFLFWPCWPSTYQQTSVMDSHASKSDLEEMILDLNPSLSQQSSASQKRVPLVERVCDYMAKQNTDTKAFLLAYLQSTNDKIVRRKKQWGSVGQGWKSTEAVLDAIDKLVNQKPECRPKWNDWILKKVLLLMFCQDVDNYTYN